VERLREQVMTDDWYKAWMCKHKYSIKRHPLRFNPELHCTVCHKKHHQSTMIYVVAFDKYFCCQRCLDNTMETHTIGEPVSKWAGCYDDSWKDLIVPEAFAHPAKMARGLLARILHHAKEQGWIKPGQVIVDPFGGIGSTGILGAYEGYQVVCCELEERFRILGEQNFQLHAHKLKVLGCPQPVILQGDSRNLCQLVEKAELILASPPYAETLKGDGTQSETAAESRAKRNTEGGSLGQSQRTKGYGSKGNLGNLKPGDINCVISSPPYQEQVIRDRDTGKKGFTQGTTQGKHTFDSYGNSPGNLGNLKPGDVSAIISSPPFGATGQDKAKENDPTIAIKGRDYARNFYGDTAGQLGCDKGPIFWQAAAEIVQQCHKILKPGGEPAPDGENIEFCKCGK